MRVEGYQEKLFGLGAVGLLLLGVLQVSSVGSTGFEGPSRTLSATIFHFLPVVGVGSVMSLGSGGFLVIIIEVMRDAVCAFVLAGCCLFSMRGVRACTVALCVVALSMWRWVLFGEGEVVLGVGGMLGMVCVGIVTLCAMKGCLDLLRRRRKGRGKLMWKEWMGFVGGGILMVLVVLCLGVVEVVAFGVSRGAWDLGLGRGWYMLPGVSIVYWNYRAVMLLLVGVMMYSLFDAGRVEGESELVGKVVVGLVGIVLLVWLGLGQIEWWRVSTVQLGWIGVAVMVVACGWYLVGVTYNRVARAFVGLVGVEEGRKGVDV